MKEIYTEIQINAVPKKVWDILVDFTSYPKWNPFIRTIQGEPRINSKIEIEINTRGGKKRNYTPIITVAEPYRELRWNGKSVIPRFFGGEHIFEIKQQQDGTVKFIQREIFNGLLVSVFGKSIDIDIRQGFEMMNRSLKERTEQSPDRLS